MTYFGYVSPKRFGPFLLPVPYQNELLRNRAQKLECHYGLGVGELVLDGIYLGLFETVRSTKKGDIIGCCSIQMLPSSEKLNALQELVYHKEIKMDFLFEFIGPITDIKKEYLNSVWQSSLIQSPS